MTNILMTGNTEYGLAQKFSIVCPQTKFVSRENEYDLCSKEGQSKLAVESLKYDVFINSSALYRFNQSLENSVVILAGGKGERLRPLTKKIPKPMLKINNKPIILHLLNKFKSQVISSFTVVLFLLAVSILEIASFI